MVENKQLLLGMDVGTSGTKSMIVDASGNILGSGFKAYGHNSPQPGWVEQEPTWYVDGIRESAAQALAESGGQWADVCGLSMTHQRLTFIPVDKKGEPLYPAIVWNDTRCSEEARWAAETMGAETIFRRTGYPPGIWSVYKVLWLKNHCPDIYDKSYQYHMVSDWLIFQLTGKTVTSYGTAATSGALNLAQKDKWDADLLKEFGLGEDIFVQDIRPSGTVVGSVTDEAAAVFNIPAGIPVVTAAGDQPCGSFGAGQFESGTLSVNGGTACTCEALTTEIPALQDPNYFVEISPTGAYIMENSIYSGASALINWFRDNFDRCQNGTGQNKWEYVQQLAEKTPPGNLGLMMIPFFGGAGAPYWNMDARGALLGLSEDHRSGHILRAIIEGLAYEIKRESDLMAKDASDPLMRLITYGGSNSIWNQTLANIFNRPLDAVMTKGTSALGAAMCAAGGVGIYKDVTSAGEAMAPKATAFVPEAKTASFYNSFYREVYEGLYDSIEERLSRARRLALEFRGD
jgi:xylulokinase